MKRQSAILFAMLLILLPVLYGRPAATPVARAAGGLPTGSFSLGTRQSGEVVGLRSRYSRTYAQDGHYVAQVSPDSVNYQDASGAWQPIDDTLVASSRSGYAWQNKANSYTASFPADIGAAPIRIETSRGWASFSLTGATGAGTVSGNSISYSVAGATITYNANPDALKESITLQGASSPSTFVYTVSTSSGLSLQQNSSGGIDVLDAGGQVQFSLLRPSMQDQAGATSNAVSMTLGQAAGASTITISASTAWLAAPARQWPVTIDPTVGTGTLTKSCTFATGGAGNCSTALPVAGASGSTAYRWLLQFDLSAIPAMSQVLSADLGLYCLAPHGATPLTVYQLTQAWTTGLTWTTYDGTHPWATPGGDFNSTAAAATVTVGASLQWYDWYPTQLVQGWVNGTVANDGLIVKEPNENVNAYCQFQASGSTIPYLKVTYSPQLGQRPFYTMAGVGGVAVNLANGNLMVGGSDVDMPGVGLPLAISRTYNSLAAGTTTDFGNGWTMDTGRDVGLQIQADGSAIFTGPTNYQVTFTVNSDGSFTSPPGIDAKLVKNGDGTYTLTDNQSGEQLNFSSGGFLTSDVDRSGNRVSFSYSGTNLASITDTQGRVTSVTSNASNQITQITDPASRTYQYGYDASKNLTSYTDPAGKVTQYTYAGTSLTVVTDPNGNQVKIAYDGSNRVSAVTEVTNPGTGAGYTTTFTYNAGSTSVTDPNNHAWVYTYDGLGRTTQLTDPESHATRLSWNSDNHVTQEQLPSGATTGYSYDSNNNLTQITSPTGTTAKWEYTDTAHSYLPTSFTDPQTNKTTYQYTAQGLLQTVTDALGHSSTTTYNSNGTVASYSDENGHQTSYGYTTGTTAGLLNSITPPAPLGGWSGTYDTANRLATETDGKNQTTTYSYDAMDRLLSAAYKNADGSAAGTSSYSWDAVGNMLSMTDPGATTPTTYSYNALDQLTQEQLPTGSTISYTWDGVDNLLTKTDGGGTTTYTYTPEDATASVKDPQAATTTFSYDVDGNQTSVVYPNGVTHSLSYNTAGDLTSIQAKTSSNVVLSSFSYSYTNPSNQLTALRQSMTDGAGNVTSYSYDALNRLSGAVQKNSGGAQIASYSYVYDNVGNLTSQTINGTTTPMTYNAADELTGAGSTSYSHDANGNMTSGTAGLGFAYNALDQTKSITPSGQAAITMAYTGSGQSRRTARGGDTFQYDETGVGSWTPTGQSSPTYFTNSPDGGVISERTPTGTHYYLYDGLGSVVGLTDSSGTVVNRYAYDAYGNATSVSETVSNPFRYTGAIWDSQTGLYKMGERYYDPTLGRFTQLDPIGGGYQYAVNDPINLVDPDGMLATRFNSPGGGGPLGGGFGLGAAFVALGKAVGTAVLRVAARLAKRLPQVIKDKWFRGPENNKFKYKNVLKHRWHFHFDPTGTGRLMQHHLPHQTRTWWHHLIAIARQKLGL